LKLIRFSYVADDGSLNEDVSPAQVPQLDYGCGFFEFRK